MEGDVSAPRFSHLKAIIVDWAGTIVDHGARAPTGALVELFRRKQVSITVAQARGPMGKSKRDHIRDIAALHTVRVQWVAHRGRVPTEEDLDALHAEYVPLQIACLREHAGLIPGAAAALDAFRAGGLRLGATTGYGREMIDVLLAEAVPRGVQLDAVVTSSDVRAGRPAPWMALEAASRLDAWPLRAVVKIGDTAADIEEGLNAGMWSIGVARTGNELGLSEAEVAALPAAELEERLAAIRERLLRAGAHYVVDSIADAPAIVRGIDIRLSRGERP